jgi:hypothetical protein
MRVFLSAGVRALRFPASAGYDARAELTREGAPAVTRNNILYLVVGALVVVAAVLGYQLYQDRKQPEGVHIDVGPNGLKIETK